MLVDELYQVEIGTASLNKKDGSRSWRLRFDFIVPPSEYVKIDSVLHAAIDLLHRNDDSGFRNLQWSIKWPSMHLLFDEERKNLTGNIPGKGAIELFEVDFNPQTIVCWKTVTILSADGKDEDEERTLVLQVRTDIPNTKKNAGLVHRFAQGRAWCRLRGTQKDSFEDNPDAKVNLDTAFATGVLSVCNNALHPVHFDSTDGLRGYLESVAKTDHGRRTHLKKLIKTGSGSEGVATSIENLNAIFTPRKIVLRDIGDINSEIASTTWAALYEIITTKSITWK